MSYMLQAPDLNNVRPHINPGEATSHELDRVVNTDQYPSTPDHDRPVVSNEGEVDIVSLRRIIHALRSLDNPDSSDSEPANTLEKS